MLVGQSPAEWGARNSALQMVPKCIETNCEVQYPEGRGYTVGKTVLPPMTLPVTLTVSSVRLTIFKTLPMSFEDIRLFPRVAMVAMHGSTPLSPRWLPRYLFGPRWGGFGKAPLCAISYVGQHSILAGSRYNPLRKTADDLLGFTFSGHLCPWNRCRSGQDFIGSP